MRVESEAVGPSTRLEKLGPRGVLVPAQRAKPDLAHEDSFVRFVSVCCRHASSVAIVAVSPLRTDRVDASCYQWRLGSFQY